jgi:hypothetical protein
LKRTAFDESERLDKTYQVDLGAKRKSRSDSNEGPNQPVSTELVKVSINGKDIQVAKGARLIDVCRESGFEIPSFCYYADLALQTFAGVGASRKMPKLQTSCTINCTDGMVVTTQSERDRKSPARDDGVPVGQPSARLSGMRSWRRVRVAGDDF